VFVFRAPRLTHFREWLKSQEAKEGEEGQRRAKRQDWVDAANLLVGRCKEWLAEADPEALLSLRIATQEKTETGLGRYEVPLLVVDHADTRVHVVPFARNTARTLSFAPGVQVQAEGRVDISNGTEKRTLYRIHSEGKERWYLTADHGDPIELNQDVFMAIMEDLLS
jgi:hypothetical protein